MAFPDSKIARYLRLNETSETTGCFVFDFGDQSEGPCLAQTTQYVIEIRNDAACLKRTQELPMISKSRNSTQITYDDQISNFKPRSKLNTNAFSEFKINPRQNRWKRILSYARDLCKGCVGDGRRLQGIYVRRRAKLSHLRTEDGAAWMCSVTP